MSINITLNGQSYPIPTKGEVGWDQEVNNFYAAIAAGCLQKSGGSFTLSAETDLGATYGLKSAYYKSRATNPASTGTHRLGNTETIAWRDAGNANDIALSVDANGKFSFNGSAVSATELGYLAGATSALQSQLNLKAPLASPTFTGTVTTSNILPATNFGPSLGSASAYYQDMYAGWLWLKYTGTGGGRVAFTNSLGENAVCGFTIAQFQIGSNNADGVVINTNCSFGAGNPSYGGGTGVVNIQNAGVLPTSNPTGGGVLFVQGGALKWRGSSGTVTTIANA